MTITNYDISTIGEGLIFSISQIDVTLRYWQDTLGFEKHGF